MLRKGFIRSSHWADKTMSALEAAMTEACEKQLASLPSLALFDPDCTDLDAETYYQFSYFPEETGFLNGMFKPVPRLHTIEELRKRVLALFSTELGLLSIEEHDLMVRLVLMGGSTPLTDWSELLPAVSLARRLWCSVQLRDNAYPVITLPDRLRLLALASLASEDHRAMRRIVENWFQTVDDVLYVLGMVNARSPMITLQNELLGTKAEGHPPLILRAAFAGFDYEYGEDGFLYLLHPALAEPDRIRSQTKDPFPGTEYLDMQSESIFNALESAKALEAPLYDRLESMIRDAVRPEISSEDAAEDLLFLAKQGVPFADMAEVLSGMLDCQPTPEMLAALRDIAVMTPRWLYMTSSRIQ